SQLVLGNFTDAIELIRNQVNSADHDTLIVVLVSGDPLFFGLGRLLLSQLPPSSLRFHPHVSAIQLAFSRIKVPWQDAKVISAHGRSLEQLIPALKQGVEKIAVLTDGTNTPEAIAKLLLALDLPSGYQLWVCENLGGMDERVQCLGVEAVLNQTFAPLNVVVLLRHPESVDQSLDTDSLPILGLPDQTFTSFSDRPGLMTKREIRLLLLGELALKPGQTVWDIGAGTGSVSIEIARLSKTSQVFAIEKTAMGSALIEQNCQRLGVNNVTSIHGSAPDILKDLPTPNRIFIGGSGGNLQSILDYCDTRLELDGIIVLALATVEHTNTAYSWFESKRFPPSERGIRANSFPPLLRGVRGDHWNYQWLQVQLSKSVPVGKLTRFNPLNPITILTAWKC
ncbi:MAG: precorrin-6y C5,15-methyltransferase (decarboxylating) subunit CbiE, partial [Moorea sp. SIO3E2]|nr:precorrin-6y C5,15-methyltransferase (decarboxylating) subunit CbiE [Moorena sp. SIO3E2]